MESYTNTTVENLKPLLTEANIHKFFDIFATTPEQFREEAKKFVLPDPQLKKYEFNPLKRFPVIKTSSKKDVETFIIPSQADFLYACFEGIYYVMLDRLGKKDKDTLWKVMGTVFEKYVGEVIKFNEIEAHSDACLFPEILYKIGKAEWKTVDWILVSDKYIVQIECKKRKIDNYARAGIQNAEGVGIDRVLEDLAIVSDKLIVKEQHIRAGKVPDISYKGQTFINLAVFLDEMFALNQYARDKIRAKMQQQSDNFYIVGCYEFEMICQQSKNKQQDIGQSVRDLTTGQCDIYKIDFLNEEYRRFFDRLMHTA